jgi:hypothetical protein
VRRSSANKLLGRSDRVSRSAPLCPNRIRDVGVAPPGSLTEGGVDVGGGGRRWVEAQCRERFGGAGCADRAPHHPGPRTPPYTSSRSNRRHREQLHDRLLVAAHGGVDDSTRVERVRELGPWLRLRRAACRATCGLLALVRRPDEGRASGLDALLD